MCGDIKSGKWMGKGYRIFWSLDGIGIPERGGMIKEFRFALPSLKGCCWGSQRGGEPPTYKRDTEIQCRVGGRGDTFCQERSFLAHTLEERILRTQK